ncbi:hypothetical protein PBI_OVECHKIN_75 [Mycobacterium phage Ovechkin]|uniref:Uncharacterized protein n=1 Tax=Mycobacterium phage Ovechkin TaxID=1673889 RepID=A0A0H4TIA0_9CAUD|nr:hypothetical protein PBI_OVECHKIN_75 [Mycobacterium phage Ovechkin]AKQ06977.1 hypothetical protein PBI_OVECHKIN_75 [Mycobacterium phage Ovechkin]
MSDQARIAELIRPWLRRRRDAEDVAELIAQLVYPRIETVEQLDALPIRSLVRSDIGEVFERLRGGWDCLHEDGSAGLVMPFAIRLPARVLYTPLFYTPSGLDEFHPDTTRNPNA